MFLKKSTENEKENEEKNKALHFELKFEHHGVPTSLVQDLENDWYLQVSLFREDKLSYSCINLISDPIFHVLY